MITVREGSRISPLFTDAGEKLTKHTAPAWIITNPAKLSAEIKGAPKYDKNELGFNVQSVIEFYSR